MDDVKSHQTCQFKHMLKCLVENWPLKGILPLSGNVGFCRGISEWLDNNTRKHNHILTKYSRSGLFYFKKQPITMLEYLLVLRKAKIQSMKRQLN